VRTAVHVALAHRRAGVLTFATSAGAPRSSDVAWALDWATRLLSGRPLAATCQLLSATPGESESRERKRPPEPPSFAHTRVTC
jgi:hypothetical protein